MPQSVLRGPSRTGTLVIDSAACLVACWVGDRPFALNSEYTDVPAAEVFAECGLAVARPKDMQRLLTDAALRHLSPDEAEQARHHRPDRVGDVLFTWFD